MGSCSGPPRLEYDTPGHMRQFFNAAAGLRGLDSKELDAALEIQGFATDRQGAMLHVVEHFSWHTGQAVWIAKARAGAGHGLAFYDDSKLG